MKDGFGCLGLHGPFAAGAGGLGETREDHFEVVIDLRDRADGAARAAHVVDLLDGDRGRDAFDRIHLRLVHALEELPRVRRKRLHIPPLAFRVDRIKGQRRLPAAARSRDDIQFPQRQVEVDALQIVLLRPADADGVGDEFAGGFFCHGDREASETLHAGKCALEMLLMPGGNSRRIEAVGAARLG